MEYEYLVHRTGIFFWDRFDPKKIELEKSMDLNYTFSLPSELIVVICSSIQRSRDLLSMSLISKIFNQTIKNNPFNHIPIRIYQEKNFNDFLHIFKFGNLDLSYTYWLHDHHLEKLGQRHQLNLEW